MEYLKREEWEALKNINLPKKWGDFVVREAWERSNKGRATQVGDVVVEAFEAWEKAGKPRRTGTDSIPVDDDEINTDICLDAMTYHFGPRE